MPRVTLSYRRDDSAGIARLIFERLKPRYGGDSVFMDIDAIEFDRDPEPFGPLWAKPKTSTPCRAIGVGPHPSMRGPPGFETVLSIDMETPERRFELCIDERSACFLVAALASYLKPFQSLCDAGTPSADALKPSVSSHSPAETLAHAEPSSRYLKST